MSDDNDTEPDPSYVEHDKNMDDKRLIVKVKYNLDGKTIKWLHSLHFVAKVVDSPPSDIPMFEATISNTQEKNAPPTILQKWNVTPRIPIKYLLNQHLDRMTLSHMSSRTLIYPKSNSKILKFQVGYMRFPSLKIHKTFRYQVHKTTST